MKSRTLTCITGIALFAALAMQLQLVTREQQQQEQHTRHKPVDMGMLGGAMSSITTQLIS
jgi:hypothetical protein